jgi:hypothetical protein
LPAVKRPVRAASSNDNQEKRYVCRKSGTTQGGAESNIASRENPAVTGKLGNPPSECRGRVQVGLATVYRVLTQFESAGLVMRHRFEGGHSVFELTTVDHHDHLVCSKCGLVEEFFDEIIEDRQDKIAANFGFEITDHSLYLYGICADCQKS